MTLILSSKLLWFEVGILMMTIESFVFLCQDENKDGSIAIRSLLRGVIESVMMRSLLYGWTGPQVDEQERVCPVVLTSPGRG